MGWGSLGFHLYHSVADPGTIECGRFVAAADRSLARDQLLASPIAKHCQRVSFSVDDVRTAAGKSPAQRRFTSFGMMKLALTFLASSVAVLTSLGADRGVIGVSVRGEPDFRVIASVVPDSPAERAGIRVGDQIVAIGNFPTSKIQTLQEFLRKVSGPPGSEIELQVKRPQTDSLLRVRLRRVAPATLEPHKIPADFERYQTSNHRNGVRSLRSEG